MCCSDGLDSKVVLSSSATWKASRPTQKKFKVEMRKAAGKGVNKVAKCEWQVAQGREEKGRKRRRGWLQQKNC
jgi:hypothetical protein